MNDLLHRIGVLDVARCSGATQTTLRIIVILLLASLAVAVLGRAIRLLRSPIESRIDDHPHLTVYAGHDKAGNAPAFKLRAAEGAAGGGDLPRLRL